MLKYIMIKFLYEDDTLVLTRVRRRGRNEKGGKKEVNSLFWNFLSFLFRIVVVILRRRTRNTNEILSTAKGRCLLLFFFFFSVMSSKVRIARRGGGNDINNSYHRIVCLGFIHVNTFPSGQFVNVDTKLFISYYASRRHWDDLSDDSDRHYVCKWCSWVIENAKFAGFPL